MLSWTARLLALLAAALALWVGLLALPSPFFAHAATFGEFRVHSTEPLPPGTDRVIADTRRRLAGMEHAEDGARYHVYLCHSPRRYAFFAFLARLSPESLAIGIGFTGTIYVNTTRVRRFAAHHHPVQRHSRFEGELSEVLAHEIAHFHSLRALGWRAHRALPVWKSEGWAEYEANRAVSGEDPAYHLAERISLLQNEPFWRNQVPMARAMWRWQLLVEYLAEVEGGCLADLVQAEVTEAGLRGKMLAWYERDRARREGREGTEHQEDHR
jgi:hypothetical protein